MPQGLAKVLRTLTKARVGSHVPRGSLGPTAGHRDPSRSGADPRSEVPAQSLHPQVDLTLHLHRRGVLSPRRGAAAFAEQQQAGQRAGGSGGRVPAATLSRTRNHSPDQR